MCYIFLCRWNLGNMSACKLKDYLPIVFCLLLLHMLNPSSNAAIISLKNPPQKTLSAATTPIVFES